MHIMNKSIIYIFILTIIACKSGSHNLVSNEGIDENNSINLNYEVELVPYPSYETVFDNRTNPLAKFVFLPLVSIKIKNHPLYQNNVFHVISIWDTGDYKKEYFGKYRTDVNQIHFDIIGDKLYYNDPINFPEINNLEKAYSIIMEDFELMKNKYLDDLNYDNKTIKMNRGKDLILSQIPNFGEFEAQHYFRRITSSQLAKYRYDKYGIVNPLFSENDYYVSKWNTKNKEEKNDETNFNKKGLKKLVENLMSNPRWVQSFEKPKHFKFIGQVDVGDYIDFESTNIYLFVNKEINKQIMIFQWD